MMIPHFIISRLPSAFEVAVEMTNSAAVLGLLAPKLAIPAYYRTKHYTRSGKTSTPNRLGSAVSILRTSTEDNDLIDQMSALSPFAECCAMHQCPLFAHWTY